MRTSMGYILAVTPYVTQFTHVSRHPRVFLILFVNFFSSKDNLKKKLFAKKHYRHKQYPFSSS